jgi:hypothetical protein
LSRRDKYFDEIENKLKSIKGDFQPIRIYKNKNYIAILKLYRKTKKDLQSDLASV